jgi:nicotinamidase-related amidase
MAKTFREGDMTVQPTICALELRAQELVQDDGGHNVWQTRTTDVVWSPSRTATVICDMWDDHWSRGAAERVVQMIPRMNEVLRAARAAGIQIVHAPSETMEFYAGSPARQRMQAIEPADPPPDREHADPTMPFDATEDNSDTGEKPWHKAWTRQHAAIEIDPARDWISDDGREIYSLFRQRGVRHMLLMGVHTNFCILNRSFGIKQMIRWGVEIALVRDLTDAMYNPACPPYVSHDEGTQLVVGYIEKFWCPTIESRGLMRALGDARSMPAR